MSHYLQIAVWNSNGLSQHRNTLQMFLLTHNIDILLTSETHFTSKSFFHHPHYITYHTNHPAGTARGGAAILIENSIQHHLLHPYSQDYLKATSIALEGPHGLITISAVYLPPKHTITDKLLTAFYATLGHRFLTGGDYNAKHTDWDSCLISPRGCVILKTMERHNYRHLSSGEPTYWPIDRNKLPDLVDFCMTKGISPNYVFIKSCFELSSDHTPVITLSFETSLHMPDPSLQQENQLEGFSSSSH
jgi:exonuclease III